MKNRIVRECNGFAALLLPNATKTASEQTSEHQKVNEIFSAK